jgi:hypothetical protein
MSQENVELVVKLLPRAGQNLVPLFRDDDAWAAFTEAVAPLFHPDFETLAGGLPEEETTYIGLDGFRGRVAELDASVGDLSNRDR